MSIPRCLFFEIFCVDNLRLCWTVISKVHESLIIGILSMRYNNQNYLNYSSYHEHDWYMSSESSYTPKHGDSKLSY